MGLTFLACATGAWAQSVNGTTGNYPFPQNRDNPFGFHSSIYNNADVQAAYDKWYADCITSSGAGGFLRVQRPNEPGLNPNSTVSEGIGYGMVIAVYMNDQNLFDNLWKYEQLHLDANGLMNWYINSDGTLGPNGSGGATDADEDMAWALLMAARQWGGSGSLSASYQSLAVSQIGKLYSYISANGDIADGGDSFGSINPSYFAPAYYREFANASGQAGWLTVAANSYTVLNANLSQGYGNASNGLDSAWCTSAGVSTNTNSAPWDYQYDACRTPFRIVEDYLWFGNSSAQSYATKTSNFFSAIGAVSIVDGYQLNGTPDPQSPVLPNGPSPVSQSAAFVGPAGVGAMVSRVYQQYIDNTYSDLVGSKLLQGGYYYDESWTVMSLLMLSDNFLDYNLYAAPTPTPTLSAYAPLTIRVNCGGPQFVDTQPATWFADQQFGGANNWGYDATNMGSTSTYTATISGTSFNQQTLYETERWGNPTYHFTVPNGYYQVLYKFCENYDGDSHVGGRVFSVSEAGTPVITNLDVYKTVGEHVAYDVPTTCVVTTGQLDIVFSSTADTSQVNAIQVLRLTTPPTATPTVPWTVTPTDTPIPATGTPTGTPTSTPTATGTLATFTPTPSATALYVNCAGPQTIDGAGITWLADQAYTTGSWGYTAGGAYSSAGPISGTTDPYLYMTERAAAGVTYIFTLPDRIYDVTLKWAETLHTATGQRLFNVVLNGNTIISNLDIYAASGGKNVAYDRTFAVTVTGGTLELDETASTDKATIMAIGIVPVVVPTETPTSSPTNTPTSNTSTPTSTPSRTPTSTLTATVSNTLTATPSKTPTASPTSSATSTPTASATLTATFTPSQTPAATWTPSFTPTSSPSPTPTASPMATASLTPTLTASPSPSGTPSATSTLSSSMTPTRTVTPTNTATATASLTGTWTPSSTATETTTATVTSTGTVTPVPIHTPSATPSPTFTASNTPSSTPTATFSTTSTPTRTSTKTPTQTATSTGTLTPVPTNTPSATPSLTQTPSSTSTSTFTSTVTVTPTFTPSRTLTPTLTPTRTPTSTPSGIVVLPPYPNPATGGAVALSVSAPAGSTIEWDVFTIAFRKVASGNLGSNGVRWDLKDKDGRDVSSGLYYLRVEVKSGSETVQKVFKILVLR